VDNNQKHPYIVNKNAESLHSLLYSLHFAPQNFKMTPLGEILNTKSIKKAEVARKTGISTTRLSQLSRNKSTILKVDELYLIALAIDVPPIEILNKVCRHIKLGK
jgi:transcriptional regulator with XRE-family HTH domain